MGYELLWIGIEKLHTKFPTVRTYGLDKNCDSLTSGYAHHFQSLKNRSTSYLTKNIENHDLLSETSSMYWLGEATYHIS